MTENSNTEASPRSVARCAGAFYWIVIVTTIYGTAVAPGTNLGRMAGLASAISSVIVTAFLFHLLKPASPILALLAAFFNLEGIAHQQNSLTFFGPFCFVIGYLLFISRFLPRTIGVLMMLAGLGLLTNAVSPLLWPSQPHMLSTIAWSFDGIGEISLAIWLLVFGVDPQRWQERAGTKSALDRRGL